jgi:hypothetical protein
VTDNAAWYMQDRHPHTDDRLVMGLDEDTPKARDATVGDIKGLTNTTSSIIELEVETRMEQFLARYNNPSALTRGLQEFNILKKDIDRDLGEIKLHKESVKNVNALIDDFQGLKTNGELLSLYKEDVALHVTARIHLPVEEHIITVYQDVLNAITIELQGFNSHSGDLLGLSFDERIAGLNSRLRVATAIQRELPDTAEVRGFITHQEYVAKELLDAVNRYDLEAIGIQLATRVPKLPLLRRWWDFN